MSEDEDGAPAKAALAPSRKRKTVEGGKRKPARTVKFESPKDVVKNETAEEEQQEEEEEEEEEETSM
jgi:hypothetical protein